MRFKGILRGGQSDPPDTWIDRVIEPKINPIMRFAPTLHRDIDAVWNAIELPWSNVRVEGQINRPNSLKHSKCGTG